MFNKRGMSHIDWAISMGIFITGMLALFILWQPWSSQDDWEGDVLTHIVMDNFLYGPDDSGSYDIKGHPICGDDPTTDLYCVTSVFYRKRVYVKISGSYTIDLSDFDCKTSCQKDYFKIKDKDNNEVGFSILSNELSLPTLGEGYYDIYYDKNNEVSLNPTSSSGSGTDECDDPLTCDLGTGTVEFSGVSLEKLYKLVMCAESDGAPARCTDGFLKWAQNPDGIYEVTQNNYLKVKTNWNYPSGRNFQICLRDNQGNIYLPNCMTPSLDQKKCDLWGFKLKIDSSKLCKTKDSLTYTEPSAGIPVYTYELPLRLIKDDPSYDPEGFVDLGGNKLETIYVSVSAW